VTEVYDRIAAFHGLHPAQFATLLDFQLHQEIVGSDVYPVLTLSLRLGSGEGRGALALLFEGVRDLKIDWPSQLPVEVDVVDIRDITNHGLEDIRYRVSEGEGLFAFSCTDFRATLE
jgi:hypothetical protein